MAKESLDLDSAERWLRVCRDDLGPSGCPEEAMNAAMRAAGFKGDLKKAAELAAMMSEDG